MKYNYVIVISFLFPFTQLSISITQVGFASHLDLRLSLLLGTFSFPVFINWEKWATFSHVLNWKQLFMLLFHRARITVEHQTQTLAKPLRNGCKSFKTLLWGFWQNPKGFHECLPCRHDDTGFCFILQFKIISLTWRVFHKQTPGYVILFSFTWSSPPFVLEIQGLCGRL